MIPLVIEGANCTMGPPEGMSNDVRSLRVKVVDDCFISRWEPTPDELIILVAGGSVELWCKGGMPPVFVTAKPRPQE